MHSFLYEGWVKHRRFTPSEHEFKYKLFMMYLDLDEIPGVFDRYWLWSDRRFNLAWLKRKDYIGPENLSIAEAVRSYLREHGFSAEGPIRLLTHLRYFGYGFNPVSFYYCFNRDDTRIEHIIAEVSNTPWKEKHYYLLDVDNESQDVGKLRFSNEKKFHVSPFLPMDMQCSWQLNQPDNKLHVYIGNHKNDTLVFDAIMKMERKPISHKNLASALIRFPFMTFNVMKGIYWQALKLWLKKVPFYSHPKYEEASKSTDKL
ncbi:MAG: DUF1365 domain-containing protein [Gammaproteobacteria bacterium]|nr:DUF1365 domain-containing protein [Gammaproteobacteria bacterium]